MNKGRDAYVILLKDIFPHHAGKILFGRIDPYSYSNSTLKPEGAENYSYYQFQLGTTVQLWREVSPLELLAKVATTEEEDNGKN